MPYRLLQQLTGIHYVTLSRMVKRAAQWITSLGLLDSRDAKRIVDTTVIRLGKGATDTDYTGYKHVYGVKVQAVVTRQGGVTQVSAAYPASWHDKRIFVAEMARQPQRRLYYLGDKAYVGLSMHHVTIPEKRQHRRYQANPTLAKRRSRRVSRARITIEHVFASLKRFSVFYTAFYFSREMVSLLFQALCVVHNIEKEMKTFGL